MTIHYMPVISAGLLMYRILENQSELFIVHPGGPFFRNKNEGYWTIPKGLPNTGEDLLDAAKREFLEETGIHPEGPFFDLGYIKQKGGKVVHAWAFRSEIQHEIVISSNTFIMEWPPKSGKQQTFEEIDKGAFFSEQEARILINTSQVAFIDRLLAQIYKPDN